MKTIQYSIIYQAEVPDNLASQLPYKHAVQEKALNNEVEGFKVKPIEISLNPRVNQFAIQENVQKTNHSIEFVVVDEQWFYRFSGTSKLYDANAKNKAEISLVVDLVCEKNNWKLIGIVE